MSKTISTIQTVTKTLSSSDTRLLMTDVGGIEILIGAAIYGPPGPNGTITNASTKTGGAINGVDIDLQGRGTILNNGSIAMTGTRHLAAGLGGDYLDNFYGLGDGQSVHDSPVVLPGGVGGLIRTV